MALSIKDPEADRLARELVRRTGESLTDRDADALLDYDDDGLPPARSALRCTDRLRPL